MKTIIPFALACAAFVSLPAQAQDNNLQAPDQKKVSYALGLNLALQSKQLGADVDVNTIIRAIRDVQAGRATQLQPSELHSIFKQEEDFARAQVAVQDKAAGGAFLATNAKNPGVTVLPDGLQYRVLKTGSGPSPKISDVVTLNYQGTLIDGTEFDHKEDFQASLATQMRGWQEALPLMKAGSKWQIFLPSNLAYGRNWMRKVGPESTVIFEIELLSVEPPSARSDGPRVIPQ